MGELVQNLPFPKILYNMILKEDASKNSPIRWTCDGEAFIIDGSKQPQLNATLLKYFNHGRYASLQRQLNMYGFKKHFSGKYEGAFHHIAFHRDKPQYVTSIKRNNRATIILNSRSSSRLGTRKRKVKRRNSEATDSTLLREAALIKHNGVQETYYYGSDVSTNNEHSVLGGSPDNDDIESLTGRAILVESNYANISRSLTQGDEGGKAVGDIRAKGGQQGISTLAAEKKKAPSNKIVLPFSLKRVMMRTWERISQQQLVQDLPATVTVRQILDKYVEAKKVLLSRKTSGDDRESIRRKKLGVRDLAEGIALFFDKGLEGRLLYLQEIPQLSTISESCSGKRLSEIYGCEHLLRLLLRLPSILTECVPDDKRKVILNDIIEFVSFLHQHQETIFVTTFRKLTHTELQELKKLESERNESIAD